MNATFQNDAETEEHAHPPLEARYAYYRRCQHVRRNGRQCKAPAMKGEAICYGHAEQLETERRRAEQRREVLSRSGAGLGSPEAVQRTLSDLMHAVIDGRMDLKAAERLIIEAQTSIGSAQDNGGLAAEGTKPPEATSLIARRIFHLPPCRG